MSLSCLLMNFTSYMCNADETGKCKDVFNDEHKVT